MYIDFGIRPLRHFLNAVEPNGILHIDSPKFQIDVDRLADGSYSGVLLEYQHGEDYAPEYVGMIIGTTAEEFIEHANKAAGADLEKLDWEKFQTRQQLKKEIASLRSQLEGKETETGCFSKIEIAGIVHSVCRRYKSFNALALIIHVAPKGSVTNLNEFAVMFTGEAYDHWTGKIYDGDYVHLLADMISSQCYLDGSQVLVRVRTPEMVICHEPAEFGGNQSVFSKGGD